MPKGRVGEEEDPIPLRLVVLAMGLGGLVLCNCLGYH